MVWKLDRLGRSLPHLLTTVTNLKERGVAFRSLTEQIDTTTPEGELLFHIFGADSGAGKGGIGGRTPPKRRCAARSASGAAP